MLRTLDKRQKRDVVETSTMVPANVKPPRNVENTKIGNSQSSSSLSKVTSSTERFPKMEVTHKPNVLPTKNFIKPDRKIPIPNVPNQMPSEVSICGKAEPNTRKTLFYPNSYSGDAPPDYGRVVWITDPSDGFRAARIIDFSKSGFTLADLNNLETVNRSYDEVFSCEEDPLKSVEDNCALMHLNEATLLNNCRLRYSNGKIYSYVANILISINPYQTIDGFYSIQKIKEYRGRSLGEKEPHIYAIADKSYREMKRSRKSQSIIVSGESGAGKTESQKAVLRYLCENWGSDAGLIQQRLLETNPILEAFGNAKTLRNNNSSRFGKFVQIHFAKNGNVAGGFVSHYLLETSRVCRQSPDERNYHIFYQLIAGSTPELYKYLSLGQPHCFNYLKNGLLKFFAHPETINSASAPKNRMSDTGFAYDTMVDDFCDFKRLENALKLSGLNEKEIIFIWSTIASILHLGNIQFEETVNDSRGGCRVIVDSEQAVLQAARLLGLEAIELRMGLCARIMQTTKGGMKGTLIRVPLKPQEASAGRNALAKAIYCKLFDWLVQRINGSIPFEKSSNFVGVLDVAGFEYYVVNSFEQFCINFCNEKLQNFFNERILKEEQELYEKEGLNVKKIDFVDNVDCIELFEKRGNGLFDLLDEEARLPSPSFKNFTKRAHEENSKHFRLDTPRKSRVKVHREMRDNEGLLIRHYAGSVCYETKHFIDKNDDQLHNSLEILIEQSTCPLLVSLFSSSSLESSKPGNKLKAQSVGSKFKTQLTALLDKLESTGTHFVRCIKPNSQMSPWQFDGSVILSQLQCAGMTSVLKLMQYGFPSRTSFGSLYSSYQKNLPPNLARMDPRLFSKCLFRALGLDQHDFQFGLTKVFFRAGKFLEFDKMMRHDSESIASLITKVNEWLVKGRWRQAQYAVWSVIKIQNNIACRAAQVVKLQSMMRGYLVRQQFQHQINVYRKSCSLLKHSEEMNNILTRLNESSQSKWASSVQSTILDLQKLIKHMKIAKPDQSKKAKSAYEHYVKRVDSIILDLRRQRKNDELDELERRRRETEENQRREEETRIKKEKEEERRRKLEEQKAIAQRHKEEHLLKQIQTSTAEKDESRQKEQQLQLDSVIPERLADDDGVAIIKPTESGSSSGNSTMKLRGQYDLTNWKYAELRDAINNSMDINLLAACEEEFRRRLRIYNEWKSRNAAKRDEPALVSAPLSIFNMSCSVPSEIPEQKCFKYAFDSGSEREEQGMFYVHFSGQYIQRQLTLRPSKMPQLMIAGRDDLQMCALTLRETGLEQKNQAEISISEFDRQWNLAGGQASS